MIINPALQHYSKKKSCIYLEWTILKYDKVDYSSKSNQDTVKEWAIGEMGRWDGDIYQAQGKCEQGLIGEVSS